MKHLFLVSIAFSSLVALQPLRAQQGQPPAADRAKVLAAAREVIDQARFCTMITLGEDGQPQARIVDAFAPDMFVTLLARAAVVTDAAEKAKHWKDAWANLYKDRNRGDDYVLVRVTPFRLEIVAPGFPNDPKTWRPVSIDLGR